MSLQHIPFHQISETELSALVSQEIGESRMLELKQDLQLATDDQKREFLSDVTALANTDGGDLIFGIREDNGVAAEIVGLRNFLSDDRIGQIENMLRDSVQPRLSGYQVKAISLSNGNSILILRIPRSFAAPHMVCHKGQTRFCGRNAAGKYDLDVQELRSAFVASEGLSDRLKGFRLDRVNQLTSGISPLPLTGPHLIVLHLQPVISARPDIRLGKDDLRKIHRASQLQPIGSGGGESTFTIDGFLIPARWGSSAYHGFVQLFRNGYLESVESQCLKPRKEGECIIPSVAWERYILRVFPGYLKAMEDLGLPPPFVASISLLNVRGYQMWAGIEFEMRRAIDRDHLLTDDILIESVDVPVDRILRPLFDQIWNGCGWEQSINYDKEGNWRERR